MSEVTTGREKPAGRGGGQSPARRAAYAGMLFALALVLGWLEALAAPFLGLPPGVKPGFANIVVVYALLYMGAGQALLLAVLKAGFAFLTRGAMAGLLSAAGGLFSLAAMAALGFVFRRLAGRELGLLLLSVAGALAHNTGQLLVVRLWFGPAGLAYAPVLLAAGVGMGCLTALCLRALLPALGRVLPARAARAAANSQNPAKSGRRERE